MIPQIRYDTFEPFFNDYQYFSLLTKRVTKKCLNRVRVFAHFMIQALEKIYAAIMDEQLSGKKC